MRKNMIVIGMLAAVALSACGGPAGYYDDKGSYHRYSPEANKTVPRMTPGASNDPRPADRGTEYTNSNYRNYYNTYDGRVVAGPAFAFNEPGYYGWDGYLLPTVPAGLVVPSHMLPPRGWCRIWFVDRQPMEQPAIQTCVGIQNYLTPNSYIIYGGR